MNRRWPCMCAQKCAEESRQLAQKCYLSRVRLLRPSGPSGEGKEVSHPDGSGCLGYCCLIGFSSDDTATEVCLQVTSNIETVSYGAG